MRVLITGGFGFIGGRLGQALYQSGHQVVLGSRTVINPPDWLPYAEVVKTDWNDSCDLEKICSGVEVVIQAAGMNAQDCAADQIAALEVNGLGTARLLAAATRVGVKRFIYLSTAHVYSSPLIGKISEESCPSNLHPYATSHLAGESAVLGANQRGDIEGVVLRLSNAFGMPAHKDVNCWMLLVNDLCRQAVETGKLVLYSNGLQQRNFITLTNVVRCVEYFLSLPLATYKNSVFNLGGDCSLSVYDMTLLVASRCQAVLGFTPLIERIEPQPEDITIPFEYSITQLNSTGFVLHEGFDDEIDSILLACFKVFKIDK